MGGYKYSLTRIYVSKHIVVVESVFTVVAEPNRRAILSLLIESERTVGEIERQLKMSQPTVSKHLRVLRERGFVTARVDAQRRVYSVNPDALREMDDWLTPFRKCWSTHLDALERHLDRIDPAPATSKKPSRRTK